MKQPTKLTLSQKKLVAKCNLNPSNWACRFEDKTYLHIVNKTNGSIRIIDKAEGKSYRSNESK